MSLTAEYHRVQQMMSEASSFQWNAFLLREDVLKRIEASTDADLKACAAAIAKRFAAWTQPEQMVEPSALFEEYGEALCLIELKQRAVPRGCVVTRLASGARAKQGLRTPDIKCTGPDGDFYIEVKVLDMVGGQYAAKSLAGEAFDNEVELAGRMKPGVNFGKPLEIAPLGKHGRRRTHAEDLDDYIRKIGGNIKRKQLTVGPTFMLVVDARAPLRCYAPSCLVPAYFQAARHPSLGMAGECVSGDWWQVGFGHSGDLILGESEFEGKGNLEGRQQANGILVDHPYLLGLSVLSQKSSEPEFRINTLAQSDRCELPAEEKFEAFDAADTAFLFSDHYNDRRNSYGFKFQQQD